MKTDVAQVGVGGEIGLSRCRGTSMDSQEADLCLGVPHHGDKNRWGVQGNTKNLGGRNRKSWLIESDQ